MAIFGDMDHDPRFDAMISAAWNSAGKSMGPMSTWSNTTEWAESYDQAVNSAVNSAGRAWLRQQGY